MPYPGKPQPIPHETPFLKHEFRDWRKIGNKTHAARFVMNRAACVIAFQPHLTETSLFCRAQSARYRLIKVWYGIPDVSALLLK